MAWGLKIYLDPVFDDEGIEKHGCFSSAPSLSISKHFSLVITSQLQIVMHEAQPPFHRKYKISCFT